MARNRLWTRLRSATLWKPTGALRGNIQTFKSIPACIARPQRFFSLHEFNLHTVLSAACSNRIAESYHDRSPVTGSAQTFRRVVPRCWGRPLSVITEATAEWFCSNLSLLYVALPAVPFVTNSRAALPGLRQLVEAQHKPSSKPRFGSCAAVFRFKARRMHGTSFDPPVPLHSETHCIQRSPRGQL